MKSAIATKTICFLFIFLCGFLHTVNAAPGDLDPTFSGDGKIFHQFGGSGGAVNATTIQPDGKILVAGDAGNGSFFGCGITRYNADGSLDPSFDGDGTAFIKVPRSRWTCSALAVQKDGKIVAVGYYPGQSLAEGFSEIVVVRLNTNGSLDPTFDGDGKVITNLTNHRDIANAVAIQPDGKIVVAGSSFAPVIGWYTSKFAVLRYNTDGSLDTTFGNDGVVTTAISDYLNVVNAVAIQPDGKIIAAGQSNPNTGYFKFTLARYNADGTLDTTFDGDGKTITDIQDGDNSIVAVKAQADGKIVAVGKGGRNTFWLSVVRYNSDGTLDMTFDGDGRVTVSLTGQYSQPTGVFFQSDGKIVATSLAGTVNPSFGIVRLKPDGSFDPTFDGDGKVETNFGDIRGGYATTVAVQPDGKIVAAGNVYTLHSSDFGVVRYNVDGTLDTSFDGDGKTTIKPSISVSRAYAVATQPDGKIVAVGHSYDGDNYLIKIIRYNPNGTLDPAFGSGGIVSTYFQNHYMFISAVTISADGKIILAGGAYSGANYHFALVRFNSDGTLDTTFNGDGKVITAVNSDSNDDVAIAVKVQPDGKIVAAGYSNSGINNNFAAVRYNTDGSLDTNFDADGKVITPVLSTQSQLNGSMAIQPDGKIVLAGSSRIDALYGFTIIRYNKDGSLDTAFDTDGKVFINFSAESGANSVAIQPDGKIIAGGFIAVDNGASSAFALARLNTDGSLDSGFDSDGKVITEFTAGLNSIASVAIQSDGKIVAAGNCFPYNEKNGQPDFALARYNTNGSLDSSYGSGGKAILDFFDQSYDLLNAMVLDADNNAVIVGEADGNFAVARVLGNAASTVAPYDFDGDGKTDIAIFRPSVGQWWINRSLTNSTSALQFGASSDRVVPGDFSGDGKTDIAVWRGSTGEWFILRSEDTSFYSVPFGTSGDIPIPADFDGDGRADVAVFRPSDSTWYISKSSGGTIITNFGATGDVPVTGDYDRDGKTDIAIYRPSNGSWWILKSATSTTLTYQFGTATDIPVQGDYTGDGRTDSAVYRPLTGEWFILRSEDYSYYSVAFGAAGDIPAPGDYDGDGKFDTAVFRPSGATWYINRSTSGLLITAFGAGNDKPIPSAFLP